MRAPHFSCRFNSDLRHGACVRVSSRVCSMKARAEGRTQRRVALRLVRFRVVFGGGDCCETSHASASSSVRKTRVIRKCSLVYALNTCAMPRNTSVLTTMAQASKRTLSRILPNSWLVVLKWPLSGIEVISVASSKTLRLSRHSGSRSNASK